MVLIFLDSPLWAPLKKERSRDYHLIGVDIENLKLNASTKVNPLLSFDEF
jgi:hypothetical protein